ncbi:MAG TPA: 2Fe-2S iron-sulfur cluster-binding protein, partial [Solirubrobacteraceae bacterium]|nr:2Fe-2S iron-sulfur cluster-binding protein [Solirubrobacteraceae bacterium]
AQGGSRIERAAPVRFTWAGKAMSGLRGDTLASALLANGVRGAWRSLYDGRPRGIMGLGPEDPCALVQVTRDGISEPMLRATEVELTDGLVAEPLAGRGRLVPDAVRPHHDHRHVHCDVLVIGGGAAGCAAAATAASGGARVILAESAPVLAGAVAPAPELTVLTRTTAVGAYDDGYVVLAQRSRLWHVRARRVILATGAVERTIAFAGNDRPGVMLAGAVRAYVERYAVAPGSTAVVFTTDDSGHESAAALAAAGIDVALVADARDGALVCGTDGGAALSAVRVREDGGVRTVACDLLAVAGGWNPSLELWTQAQGTLRWDDAAAAFLPDAAPERWAVVGAAAGARDAGAGVSAGIAAGAEAARATGFPAIRNGHVPPPPRAGGRPPLALFAVEPEDGEGWGGHYLDLQRDAVVADLRRAVAAGMRSPEHVKRFTTIGTASDQGRTSGVLTLGVLAGLLGVGMAELRPTTHRPPAVPVSFSLLAGRDRGVLSDPVRTTAIHPWHVANGAAFEDVGQWKRPWYYPSGEEDMDAAVLRECRAARGAVAMMDASTLGKIDVQGPDAAEFLDRLYTGDFGKLGVGRCKYGILCTADGMLFDDGVHMRLAEDRYLVTTTTGNAAAVLDWFEEWLQTEWPGLRVHCTSVTEQWATVAVVGPRSRDVLAALAPGLDASAGAFRFMDIREADVAGMEARVCRISFSGELAYEINVPVWHGLAMWEAVWAAGEPFGITPYGTETMHVLRAEKGYVIVGQETDGTVTPQDLGLDWMIAKGKGDFVGKRSHRRIDAMREDRKQLVALLPSERVPEGAQLVLEEGGPMMGHVTSSYDSAALGRPFCLALLGGGRARHGETVLVALAGGMVEAEVADPVLYDPEGARRDGA